MSMMILNREIFFSFYNYEYYLDVQRQNKIYTETISLDKGIKRIGRVVFSK